MLSKLSSTLRSKFQSRFAKNLGWLGFAEVIGRIFRLAVTVTMARTFAPTDYAMVSAAYTVFAFGNSFSLNNAMVSKIVQVDDEHLEATCNTTYWMSWVLTIFLTLLQIIFAHSIADFYQAPRLVFPLMLLTLIYWAMPFSIVQEGLIQRANRLDFQSRQFLVQAIIGNLALLILVPFGFGVWAVVISMIIPAPFWIWAYAKEVPWRPKAPRFDRLREILLFSTQASGIEWLNHLKLNIDYLIIVQFLGPEALGQYFFAFNAGLGISQSVLYSLSSAFYPNFCDARFDGPLLRSRYLKSCKTIGLVVVPLVILQTTLAPIYVPLIFGQKWVDAVPILRIICCSAIPIAFGYLASDLLKSIDRMVIDIIWNISFAAILGAVLLSIVKVANGDLMGIAIGVLSTYLLLMPAFSLWVYQSVIQRYIRKLAA